MLGCQYVTTLEMAMFKCAKRSTSFYTSGMSQKFVFSTEQRSLTIIPVGSTTKKEFTKSVKSSHT